MASNFNIGADWMKSPCSTSVQVCLVVSLKHFDEISTFSLQRKGEKKIIHRVNSVILTNGSSSVLEIYGSMNRFVV